MKDLKVPIDQAGRIVLPKSIREELALKPGDTLKVTVAGPSAMLTPLREQSGFIRRGKALIFASGDAILTHETVNGLISEARNERAQEIIDGFSGGRGKG